MTAGGCGLCDAATAAAGDDATMTGSGDDGLVCLVNTMTTIGGGGGGGGDGRGGGVEQLGLRRGVGTTITSAFQT